AKNQDSPRWLLRVLAALPPILLAARLVIPDVRSEDRVTPLAALAYVPSSLRAQPVLNAYDYGGYLIHQGVKVFIDGRTDMYPAGFLKNDDQLAAGDPKAMSATLARYNTAW